jgi:hypothetical protein
MASSPAPAWIRHGDVCSCHACNTTGELTAQTGHRLFESGRLDPTSTTSIQRAYARFLRGRIEDLDADVRELLVDEDALGLGTDTGRWGHLDDAQTARAFDEWFQDAVQRNVLAPHDREQVRQWFERAAERAIRDANADLRRAARQSDELSDADRRELLRRLEDPEDALERPEARSALALQHEDARQRVASWMDDFTTDARRLVTAGLGAGAAKTAIARDIVRRGQVYKSHVTSTASGRIVNTYNTRQLTSYENVRADIQLETEVEYVDAGDNRVCEECLTLSAQDWTLERAQDEDPIPVHGFCRCRFSVVDVRQVF